MQYKNFKKQINESNKFLKLNKNNVNLVSLSFLHILRPQYDLIKNFNSFYLKYRISYHLKYSTIKFLKYLFSYFQDKKKLSKEVDLLILSNFTNLNHLNNKLDFYFGNLQYFLNKNKINCHTVFRNFTRLSTNELRKKNKIKNHHFLDDFDKINCEISYFFLFFFEYLKYKIFSFQKNKNFLNNKNFSFLNFLTGISSLRLANLILKFIKESNPKMILITLEGHAWEKVLTRKLREKYPKIIIAGYQFSVLSKNTNSLFLKLDKKYEQDFIFTKNKIHKNFFIHKGFEPSKIKILGDLKKEKIQISKIRKINNIIICPEALDYENEVMFSFAENCAKKINDYNFIFRPHPSYNKKFISRYKNLKISKTTLKNDLLKSKILIYRGSSVCYYAKDYKILPIYLKTKNEISIDPLYYFKRRECKILSVNDLKKFIYKTPNLESKIKKLLKINMQFSEKPNLSIIKKILNDK